MGDIETELAPALQFLLSDAASFITSQIWGSDGASAPAANPHTGKAAGDGA